MQVNKCLPLEKNLAFHWYNFHQHKIKENRRQKMVLKLFNKKDDSLCKEFKIRNESKIEQNYTDIKKSQEFSI